MCPSSDLTNDPCGSHATLSQTFGRVGLSECRGRCSETLLCGPRLLIPPSPPCVESHRDGGAGRRSIRPGYVCIRVAVERGRHASRRLGVWHFSSTDSDPDTEVVFYQDALGWRLAHRQEQAREYTVRLAGYLARTSRWPSGPSSGRPAGRPPAESRYLRAPHIRSLPTTASRRASSGPSPSRTWTKASFLRGGGRAGRVRKPCDRGRRVPVAPEPDHRRSGQGRQGPPTRRHGRRPHRARPAATAPQRSVPRGRRGGLPPGEGSPAASFDPSP